MTRKVPILAASSSLVLAGCGLLSSQPPAPAVSPSLTFGAPQAAPASETGHEVVLFALGLLETGYRFGGKNPEAGLDCSGMVSYVFEKAAGRKVAGSAADIARQGKAIDPRQLKPGDLVFFNTRNRPYSHVGIYIGEGRFIHAPSSKGKVRAESLKQGWFAARFEDARTYFD
jgi:cell wall-associated NlpC family hydrolase